MRSDEEEERFNLEKERLKIDRYKTLMSAVIALVGVTVATMFLYTQFLEQRRDRSISNERLLILQERLEERLRRLEERLEKLERRQGGAFLFIVPVQGRPNVTPEKPGEEILKKPFSPVLREYILPAIYSLLGLILLASAVVALSTKDAARKDTAAEMTKTLMSFFIGAATGQV
jgi:hypothetical protein